ncbi:Dps family protein [Rhodovulum adriaticum]|uniref:Starvation-inducible DNA-binding protein n=1 Tax=Rhodovulum adriaticum TaxID=35804 RepID=A0A4R2NYT6_RHOAD|nr:Dps family protein [Rhodovulum adriaticum]MBK1634992.1 DNA starvation/stationary phase protection protein [Rhodovulum adriaticum]TCP27463.1 starvation-inducible DNA-binding protein [Rhodovulum adriaticum]
MDNDTRKAVAGALARVLGDTFVLYTKAHNFHWNVEGPKFFALHEMFEAQYTELADAMDAIAERIRALDEYAPGTTAALTALASVKETDEQLSAEDMIAATVADYETVCATVTEALKAAQDAGDEASAGMLGERLEVHQKAIWMMKSLLK